MPETVLISILTHRTKSVNSLLVLQNPVTVKEYGAITDIDFCQVKPHNFAVTNSMRVSET